MVKYGEGPPELIDTSQDQNGLAMFLVVISHHESQQTIIVEMVLSGKPVKFRIGHRSQLLTCLS